MIDLIQTSDQIIAVDIVGAFAESLTAEESKYPVEDGSSRVDHKIFSPGTIDLEISQTEYPLDDPEYSLQDLTARYDVATAVPSVQRLEIRDVQTIVLSPFLLAGAGISRLTNRAPRTFTGLRTGSPEGKSLRTQVLQTSNPRDRGGELKALLEGLYFDPDATCSITYRGQTSDDLSLISLTRSYNTAGLTVFQCSFQRRLTASIEVAELFDPAEIAHRSSLKQGKTGSGSDEKAAQDHPPKSIAKALFS